MGPLDKARLEAFLSQLRRHRRGFRGATRRPSKAVVLDNGSGMLRAGWVGEEAPRVVLRSTAAVAPDDAEALARRCAEALRRLGVAPAEAAILLIEPASAGERAREAAGAALFKLLKVPALTVMAKAPLTLLAHGRSTGVVVDVGEGSTEVAAIIETAVIARSRRSAAIGERHLVAHARKAAAGRGLPIDDPKDLAALRRLIGELGYVALDYDEELRKTRKGASISAERTLPSGRSITIGSERFRVGEALFKPSLIGLEEDGIHREVARSIEACDVRRGELYANTVMSGGTTMLFPGIDLRLARSLAALAPESMTLKVALSPDRDAPSWRAASGLASLSTFEEMWIPRDEYDESGPGILGAKYT